MVKWNGNEPDGRPLKNNNENTDYVPFSERMEDDDFAIYYRNGLRTQLFSPTCNPTNIGHRDHILTEDGETICDSTARVITSDAKPFSEVTDWEWSFITTYGSNLCVNCLKIADDYDMFPDDVPEEVPEFPCPECGEKEDAIENIGYAAGVPIVVHQKEHLDRDIHHEFDYEIYDEWRRGEATDRE